LTHTHPNISFAVVLVARYMQKPHERKQLKVTKIVSAKKSSGVQKTSFRIYRQNIGNISTNIEPVDPKNRNRTETGKNRKKPDQKTGH
jgi:hypothetical protein